MIVRLSKRFTFEAAHELPYHQGKCHHLHGHSYILDVTVEGPIRASQATDPASGMVMDFSDLSQIVKRILGDGEGDIDPADNQWEHRNINNLMHNPTAENMAVLLAATIEDHLSPWSEVRLVSIRLYETQTGWVEVLM